MPTRVRNVIGPIFHVAVCAHHIYAMVYSRFNSKDFLYVADQRVQDVARFAPVYFTSWNMIIQTVYFLLAMFHDFLYLSSTNQDLQNKILLHKGYIFTSLLFPCSLFVSTMFWGTYSINREWVFPEILDDYIPVWLNHSMHTNIVVFLMIEVLIANQLLPSFKSAFIGLSVLTGIYHSLFLFIYFQSGRWIYGLFHVFSWPERIVFMCANYLLTVLTMKIGITIQNFKYNLSTMRAKRN